MAREVAAGMAPAIGIDLGTTHSCVAYIEQDGKARIIKTKDNNTTMPSHVAFTKSGRKVGVMAKYDVEKSDGNTIYDAKRLIGRSYTDPEIADDLKTWPFHVEPNAAGLPRYRVVEQGQEKLYSPEEISAFVLMELRAAAQQHFGSDRLVKDVIITVPAYFNDDQRQATKAAAEIADLNVLHLLNEPTAAAMAFGLKYPAGEAKKNVLVFDLGGGTFDTVLLERSKDTLQVRNIGGDTHLGGQDFDWQLMRVALTSWDAKHPEEVLHNGSKSWRRLRLQCEAAKKELTTEAVAAIELEGLQGNHDFFMEIDRDEFEYESSPLFERCMSHVTLLLQGANLTVAEVHDLVVVGGASRIPGVRHRLAQMFPTPTCLHMTDDTVNADEAVAVGAAIMATQKSFPTQQDFWRPVSPRAELVGPTVIEVTPMTLGIQHGEMKKIHPLIPKGSRLPARASQSFTTLFTGQTSILFQVFEGEHPYACDNHMLGMFQLPNIAHGPAGAANILVTMHVDEASMLHVDAVDQKTGNARQLVVTAMNRANAVDVKRMKEEAQTQQRWNFHHYRPPLQNGAAGGWQSVLGNNFSNGPPKRSSKVVGF